MARGARSALLVLACACVWGAVIGYGYDYIHRKHHIEVKCINGVRIEPNLPKRNRTLRIFMVKYIGCPPPAESYAADLAALNVNVSALRILRLEELPAATFTPSHFTGLFLYVLDVKYSSRVEQNITFLDSLVNLKRLTFEHVNVPPLPESSLVEHLILVNGGSEGSLGGCSELHLLYLSYWEVEQVAERWLAHCSQLTSLTMVSLPNVTSEVLRRVLGGASSLHKLKINDCKLEMIGEELADLDNLRWLDVSDNHLQSISAEGLPPSLTELFLFNNRLWSSALVADVLQRTPALKKLSLSDNPSLDLCDDKHYQDAENNLHLPLKLRHIALRSLTKMSVLRTATSELCFGGLETDSLEELSFGPSNISVIQFRDLPVTKVRHFELYVKSSIRELVFEEADYEMLSARRNESWRYNKFQQISISGVTLELDCDCQHAWLVRAVRERKLYVNGAKCNNDALNRKGPAELAECDKFACAGGACTCRRAWRDNATIARCDAGTLLAVPRVPGLRALHAAGNLVHTLSAEDLPDTLTLLDLSHNNVARVDAAAAAALFARPDRGVRLAHNPLLCDCDNRALLAALQEHRAQVEDYDRLACSDGRALRDVPPGELCAATQP